MIYIGIHTVIESRLLQQCDFFMPTFNTFIMNHIKLIWRNLLFAFCLKLLKISPRKTLMHKIKRKEQNRYAAVWTRRCVYSHTTHFPLHKLFSRFPRLFHIPRTQYKLNNAVFYEDWFAFDVDTEKNAYIIPKNVKC